MKLTEGLPADLREHVEARLRGNLIAWLTTVRPDGQPVSVPVWFLLQDDETIIIYSQPNKAKLRNLADNPKVALGLDVTDLGRDIVRLAGVAELPQNFPPADRNPRYVSKYTERAGAIFGTVEHFAELFSVPLLITPTGLWT